VFSPLQNGARGVVKACTEKGIVGKGKGRCTLIQGVTAPLNCRVFINPRSYVLILSSIPLCHLQLSDKHFRNIGNYLKANLQLLTGYEPWTRKGTEIIRRINFATDRWPFYSVKNKLKTGSRIFLFELSVLTSDGLQWNVCKEAYTVSHSFRRVNRENEVNGQHEIIKRVHLI
jgi:hypothetical protein